MGEYDVSSETEAYPYEEYSVNSIRIHNSYQNDTLINDISVLTLTQIVRNKPHISPVCIPTSEERFDSGSCVVSGWGNREPIPKKYYVECLNDEDCQNRLRKTRLGRNYVLHEGFLCAKSRDVPTCLVDGGAPLVCKRKGPSPSNYALVGLVSWTVDDNSPEVYVRVQNYLEWLDDQNQAVDETPQPPQGQSPSPPAPTYPDESPKQPPPPRPAPSPPPASTEKPDKKSHHTTTSEVSSTDDVKKEPDVSYGYGYASSSNGGSVYADSSATSNTEPELHWD